jgi:hypothetical protein
MQTDGNLVVYNASNKPVWATNTLGKGGTYVIIQGSDGNLVLYTSSDSPVWSSNTAGTGANNLVLNDDGSLWLWQAAWRFPRPG